MSELFAVHVPIWEIVVRGTAMYWLLFALFRFALRRDVGAVGIADVLLVVLIADAAQNAMAGEYNTVTEGALLVCTLVGWNVFLDWMAFRFPAVAAFVEPPALRLVTHGRILHRNLRREFVTVDDLMSKLRGHGIEELAEVKAAYLEGDGQVTVIREDRRPVRASAPRAGGPEKRA